MGKQKVVLFHGLYLNPWMMKNLAKHLESLGYEVLTPGYRTLRKTCQQNAQALEPELRTFKQDTNLYFVGYSLGGLLIRHLNHQFPDLFRQSRVVTLGTPHQGSIMANKVYHCWSTKLIGAAWYQALDGDSPKWNSDIPLLSVAGTRPFIENKIVRAIDPRLDNDGVVSLAETQLEEMCAFQAVYKTHGQLMFGKQVAELIDVWFKKTVEN